MCPVKLEYIFALKETEPRLRLRELKTNIDLSKQYNIPQKEEVGVVKGVAALHDVPNSGVIMISVTSYCLLCSTRREQLMPISQSKCNFSAQQSLTLSSYICYIFISDKVFIYQIIVYKHFCKHIYLL